MIGAIRRPVARTKKEDSISRLIMVCQPAVSVNDDGLEVPRHRISINQ